MKNNIGGAVVILVIVVAAALMFSIPLIAMSEKTYDSAREKVASAAENLKNKVIRTAELTQADLDSFVNEIEATGNTFDVEYQIDRISENASKKISKADGTVQSTDNYTSEYTTQILNDLKNEKSIKLEPGSKFSVSAVATNRPISEIFNGRSNKIEVLSSGVVGK